jgi:hypothetical protein
VGPNHQHLVANNRTFLPLGFNIAWPTPNGSVGVLSFYEQYFEAMAAVGGNFARVWLGPCLNASWSFNRLTLLTTTSTAGSAPQINLTAATVLDQLLDLAASYGIRLLLALDSFNSLCPASVNAECRYEGSVWAPLLGGENGLGFLGFWTANSTVAAWVMYQGYVANRYGAHPALLALQLFNEVDAADFDVLPASYGWHVGMAARLHVLRPTLLVSESFGLAAGNPIIDSDRGFDVTTTHYYARTDRGGSPNLGPAAAGWAASKRTAYGKPSWVGEFGCNDDAGQPLSRAAFHDGLWAPVFGGAAAFSSAWYWDTIPTAWWQHEFRVLSRVVRDHLEAMRLAARGVWAPWELMVAAEMGVEVVATRATADGAFFLVWLHDSRNGSDPCAHAPTRSVPPFVLELGRSEVGTQWNVNASWVDTSTGDAFPVVVSRQGELLTRTFVGDAVLIGQAR